MFASATQGGHNQYQTLVKETDLYGHVCKQQCIIFLIHHAYRYMSESVYTGNDDLLLLLLILLVILYSYKMNIHV